MFRYLSSHSLFFFISLFINFVSPQAGFASERCEKWFIAQKIKQGQGCLVECSMADVGMGTSSCPVECPDLCNISFEKELLHNLAYYPGLSKAEYALLTEYPKDAFKVYQMKNIAEDKTQNKFERNDTNDESDAFRHFLWAALTTKEIGSKMAKKFLDAHELKGNDSELEKTMDEANNRAGIQAAEQLIKDNKFSQENIEKEALKLLKNKKLQFIVKKGIPK